MKLAFAALALAASIGGASAQTSSAPTGGLSGGGVSSTATGAAPITTGSTTAVGQTKPPGVAVGDQMGTRPDLERDSQKIDRQIRTGICNGC